MGSELNFGILNLTRLCQVRCKAEHNGTDGKFWATGLEGWDLGFGIKTFWRKVYNIGWLPDVTSNRIPLVQAELRPGSPEAVESPSWQISSIYSYSNSLDPTRKLILCNRSQLMTPGEPVELVTVPIKLDVTFNLEAIQSLGEILSNNKKNAENDQGRWRRGSSRGGDHDSFRILCSS